MRTSSTWRYAGRGALRCLRVAVGAAVATYTKIEDTLSGSTDKGTMQQAAGNTGSQWSERHREIQINTTNRNRIKWGGAGEEGKEGGAETGKANKTNALGPHFKCSAVTGSISVHIRGAHFYGTLPPPPWVDLYSNAPLAMIDHCSTISQ